MFSLQNNYISYFLIKLKTKRNNKKGGESFPNFLNMANKRTPVNSLKDEEKEKQHRVHSSTNSVYVSSLLIAPNKDDLMHW